MTSKPTQLLAELLTRYPVMSVCKDEIAEAFNVLSAAFRQGGTLYTCGNGGSAADSEHLVGELLKSFLIRRSMPPADARLLREADRVTAEDAVYLSEALEPGLPAVALTGHPSLSSAVRNDMGADLVYAQQLYVLGKKGDVLLGLSTSGNARNVRLASAVARSKGMFVIALTGASGGRLREAADLCIRVPEEETFLVQELHLPVYHTLCAMLEAEFFDTPD